jgi:hypothetical protein
MKMQGTTTAFVPSLAGRTRRGWSRALAHMAVRRRLAAVCAAALTLGLGAAAFTVVSAAPASAAINSTPTTSFWCLDANAQQVYDGGQISQYSCNGFDPYQSWSLQDVGRTNYGEAYKIFSDGAYDTNNALDCLEANAYQVYNGGQIIQYGCNASDPYQEWIPSKNSFGTQWENYGDLLYNGVAMCLDAYGGQQYNGGTIMQYACNGYDEFQYWGMSQTGTGASSYAGYQFYLTQVYTINSYPYPCLQNPILCIGG